MANAKKPLAAALGAAFLATSVAPLASAAVNPFSAQQLSGGYDLAAYDKDEGAGTKAQGEGSCGGSKKAEGEGSCGGGKKAGDEGSCGAGKTGDETQAGGDTKADGEGKCGG
jgi:hypothetical protein